MQIFINGEAVNTKAEFLADLLLEHGFEGDWLATAVNSELVPAEERAFCALAQNDRIEVLSPMQGG